MRKFKTVFMRGGTSKGCIFHREDLPLDIEQWDDIFLQVMGAPDPKQIDGLGGTVSSNNKIVVVWPSDKNNVDIEYLVGQVVPGKNKVDYKSNCGNMTAAVGAFAIEEKMLPADRAVTTVRLLNKNTDSYINIEVPCEKGTFVQEGKYHIAGVDGTASEIKVNFLYPAGAKTGKLLPTGNVMDILEIPNLGSIEVTIIDVSNIMVLVRAEDIGMMGTELPDKINENKKICDILENIRGVVCCMLGLATDVSDAIINNPSVPKIGFCTHPISFTDITGKKVFNTEMDICVRVMSLFKCHKACPLTSANAIAVATQIKGSVTEKIIYGSGGDLKSGKCVSTGNNRCVRIGHPSGIMTLYPDMEEEQTGITLHAVSVSRTARRIMQGMVYIKN